MSLDPVRKGNACSFDRTFRREFGSYLRSIQSCGGNLLRIVEQVNDTCCRPSLRGRLNSLVERTLGRKLSTAWHTTYRVTAIFSVLICQFREPSPRALVYGLLAPF